MKTITVDVAPNGETRVEAHGFQGTECLRATESLRRALGVFGELQPKVELYEVAGAAHIQQQERFAERGGFD